MTKHPMAVLLDDDLFRREYMNALQHQCYAWSSNKAPMPLNIISYTGTGVGAPKYRTVTDVPDNWTTVAIVQADGTLTGLPIRRAHGVDDSLRALDEE